MRLLGVDPGHLTGYSIIEIQPGDPETLNVENYGQILFEDVPDWLGGLETEGLDIVVMEEFKLLPGKAVSQSRSSNSQMKTSQVEGMVKFWAAQHKIKVVLQNASVKRFAEKQSSLKPSGAHNKNSHWIDSVNHVYYYLIQMELIPIKTSSSK